MFEYRAKVDRVVDGDTLDVIIDLGFNIEKKVRVRLKDVDTHEIYGVDDESEEYELGQNEAEFVKRWVHDGTATDYEYPFIIKTFEDDNTGKYGRYLARVVRRSDDSVLHENLLDNFDDIRYNS